MKTLNIGIDIDDTIANTFNYLMPAVAEFYNMDLDYLKENKISYTTLTPKMKEQELEFAKANFDKLKFFPLFFIIVMSVAIFSNGLFAFHPHVILS